MTNKQKVKNIFPSTYTFKLDDCYEVWVDGLETWVSAFFNGAKGQLFPLSSGNTLQKAWKNAWIEVQQRMLKKLEQ